MVLQQDRDARHPPGKLAHGPGKAQAMYVHRIGSQRRKALNQPFRAGACTGPRPGVIGSGDEMVVHAMDCEIFFLLAGLQDGYLGHRGRGCLGNLND
jgi:hypothetical protein